MIKPRELFPNIELKLSTGKTCALYDYRPGSFILLIAYRGYHSMTCRKYLKRFDEKIIDFNNLGVHVIAMSSDTAADAKKTKNDWQLENLEIVYGVEIPVAQSLGLFVSKSMKPEEPDLFIEPGLFVINKDHTLYASTIQTMAFTRPKVDDILSATKFVIEHNYPPRGDA